MPDWTKLSSIPKYYKLKIYFIVANIIFCSSVAILIGMKVHYSLELPTWLALISAVPILNALLCLLVVVSIWYTRISEEHHE